PARVSYEHAGIRVRPPDNRRNIMQTIPKFNLARTSTCMAKTVFLGACLLFCSMLTYGQRAPATVTEVTSNGYPHTAECNFPVLQGGDAWFPGPSQKTLTIC